MSGSKWTIRINPYLYTHKKLISGSGRFGIFEDDVGFNKQVDHDNDEFKANVKHHPMKTVTSIMTPKYIAYIPPMFASQFLKHASYDALCSSSVGLSLSLL